MITHVFLFFSHFFLSFDLLRAALLRYYMHIDPLICPFVVPCFFA